MTDKVSIKNGRPPQPGVMTAKMTDRVLPVLTCPKEGMFVMSVSAIAHGAWGVRKVLEARFTETERAAICKLWAWRPNGVAVRPGFGIATGCGYHRPSAALARALDYCGFVMSADVFGAGDRAITDAILGVCACVWPGTDVELIVSE